MAVTQGKPDQFIHINTVLGAVTKEGQRLGHMQTMGCEMRKWQEQE